MRILTFLLLLVALPAFPQYNTGDRDLDKTLVRIDADASVNFGAFRADMSSGYNITEKKIDYLAADVGMKAGDIYMSVRIARITSKPLDDVVRVYNRNKGQGWGAIAKELGIKPGSAEFHELKGNSGKGPGKSNGKGKGKGKN